MSTLIDFSLDVTSIPKELLKKGKNGNHYLNATISVDDKTGNFGTNVSMFVSQTEEERSAGAKRKYLGNGKVFWTSGTVSLAEKMDQPKAEPVAETVDLPF